MDKEKFTDLFNERRPQARAFLDNWRTTAIDAFAFISGKQWIQEDEDHLKEEGRVAITFNYSEKMIDAVVGAEVSNRQEATYRPRGIEDAAVAELWNNAAKWVRDECAAEDEESDAFRDMLICGMGWTGTRLSYDEDQDGKLLIERIDPLEMWYDPASSKPGITDRRYAGRDMWVDEREAKKQWPDGIFLDSDDESVNRGVIQHGNRYNGDMDESEYERHKGQVLITIYECVEREPATYLALNGQLEEIPKEDFKTLKPHLDDAGAQYVTLQKRVYYRGFFSGDTCLDMGKSPCQDGFTFQAITGKRDRNSNTWYGLTRVMMDPQRWANKWLSQILHIVNSNAKGGLMAEINAFVDPVKAQEEWSKPDSITLFKEGALSGNRVKEKTAGNFPSGLDKLMQFALGSLPMVTGINLEALGLANREQAGVLEQQRKQAAYGLLAPLFDSLRRYRKSQGRVLLHMINQYISDGRMIRIGGPESTQTMPLTKVPDSIRYDVIVDQSPNAPDVKERTWQALMELVPSMMKAGIPVPPDLLDYTPLPVALITKWKQFAAQNPPPDPKMEQMQQELQQLQEENQQLKLDQSNEMAQIQMKSQQMQQEMILKRQQVEADIKLKMFEMNQELEIKRHEAAVQLQMTREQGAADLELANTQAHNDMAIANKKAETQNEVAKIAAKNKPKPTSQ